MPGVWIIECSELAAISRGEFSRYKSFISRRVDRFRAPYDRRMSEYPRQCVFAGSTNDREYLKDPTGNRRFWPVLVSKPISIEVLGRLRDNRNQLWAEGFARYKAGDIWWIADDEHELQELIEAEQNARMERDPWHATVMRYMAGKDCFVSAEDVLKDALELTAKDWTQPNKRRVGQILQTEKDNWVRVQRQVDGIRVWGYKPVGELEEEGMAAPF
jgi:putative DNA primase/helicase